MTIHLPLLTVSRARSFRRCARHHYHAYEQGYRPLESSGPLTFGTLWHKALEIWWSGEEEGTAIQFLKAVDGIDEFTRVALIELLWGYAARWAQEQDMVPLRVEAEFVSPLTNPKTGAASRTFQIGGKIDLIVRDQARGGDVWLMEHKTTSEDIAPGSPYWQKLRLDAQISTYLNGARSLGFDPVGCVYDVAARPSLRPLKATPEADRKYVKGSQRLYANQREADETPEEYQRRVRAHILENPERYYQRGEVVRLDDETHEAAWDLWQTARAIREAELEERWPRNPEACFHWNRPCEFFPVCTGSDRLENSDRYRKLENIHEELSHAASPTGPGIVTPAHSSEPRADLESA